MNENNILTLFLYESIQTLFLLHANYNILSQQL